MKLSLIIHYLLFCFLRGRTALHLAVHCGHVEIADWLLSVGGANIETGDDEDGETAIHFAARGGQVKLNQAKIFSTVKKKVFIALSTVYCAIL